MAKGEVGNECNDLIRPFLERAQMEVLIGKILILKKVKKISKVILLFSTL